MSNAQDVSKLSIEPAEVKAALATIAAREPGDTTARHVTAEAHALIAAKEGKDTIKEYEHGTNGGKDAGADVVRIVLAHPELQDQLATIVASQGVTKDGLGKLISEYNDASNNASAWNFVAHHDVWNESYVLEQETLAKLNKITQKGIDDAINRGVGAGTGANLDVPKNTTPTIVGTSVSSAASPHTRQAAKPVQDTITITTQAARNEPRGLDGADAHADAASFYKAVHDLQAVLSDRGGLPAPASLKINVPETLDGLTKVIQDDYTSKKPSDLTLKYTDHLGGSSNKSLGTLRITHDNIDKVTKALEDAERAVEKLIEVHPGVTVTQDQISQVVRKVIEKDLALPPR